MSTYRTARVQKEMHGRLERVGVKLVQMPVDLLHVGADDLPGLGVDPALLRQLDAYFARCPDATESLAIFGPPAAGTRELLMVLARQVGAGLRDENIHLRERGGDLEAGRKKLCYLPGSALAEALRDPAARQTLGREAACFLQDVDAALLADGAGVALLELVDARHAAELPTFLSAHAAGLPPGLERGLRARLKVIEPN